MPFARLETGFFRHPKGGAAGLHGRALYMSGLCFCAEQLTDGRIPKGSVPIVAAEAGVKPSVADTLVEVGLWHDRGDHYAVNDYFERGNPTREKVLKERDAARTRQERLRASRPVSRRDNGRDDHSDQRRESHDSHSHGLGVQGFTSSSSVVNAGADDDDGVIIEPRVETALAILGQHDVDRAISDGIEVKNPGPYLVGCTKGRRLSDLRPLAEAAAEHPDWTAQQLADTRLGGTNGAAVRPQPEPFQRPDIEPDSTLNVARIGDVRSALRSPRNDPA